MKNFNPTPQQTNAIEYDHSMIITACPGSGKTTVIKEKIRSVTSELPSYKGVIAITFTIKASEELELRCKKDAHDTKNSFFGTIDSFCLSEVILPFLRKVWGGDPSQCRMVKKLGLPYSNYIRNTKNPSPTLEDIDNDHGFKRLYDEGILVMNTFSGLALKILNNSLSSRRYLKSRYSHVFIDEYQDASLSQHQLFLKLNELGLTSVAVGDIWQSIYEFRGGSSELLMELVSNEEVFKHFEINLNHRCHPSIINYASRLLDRDFELLETPSINVFRRRIEGNLTDIGDTISEWISDWLKKNMWDLNKPKEIAILTRKEDSLKLLSLGMKINYRLYIDTPLDKIETDCSSLFMNLLKYKYDLKNTTQEVVNLTNIQLKTKGYQLVKIRKRIEKIRQIDVVQDLVNEFNSIAEMIGFSSKKNDNDALIRTLEDEIFLNRFRPTNDQEIQMMTLHKSKGLEFKLVLHFDMDEWSFPFRLWNDENKDIPIYPSLQQETNLHYVGITRAENCCVLINAGKRLNSLGNFSNTQESYFFKLEQLSNLYS
ncbi:ATP-dependent helicase [Pectobacterium brasiliense]|uniref:UvrD-helicase domain-containing protein n=1 Tax=Pectobacterium brasiliense TaxID=180957 RepID=UPI002404D825|nr:ATP-dependent helicase [Pectobacterium brasiliense]MDG0805672.1 ATP-dependent helicase [Pectobacterium brasiliense]